MAGSSAALGRPVLLVLLAVRILGALLLPMTDCDETYNYWEPAHYALFGSGMQTWEYANEFALRSWLFVWLYAWPAKVLATGAAAIGVTLPKPVLFYAVKVVAAAATALAERHVAVGMAKRFGSRAGKVSFIVALSCAGTALAAPQFLPSSFAMITNMFALGSWLKLDAVRSARLSSKYMWRSTLAVVGSVAAGAIVGWPFAALVGLPVAIDVLAAHTVIGALQRRGGVKAYVKAFIIGIIRVGAIAAVIAAALCAAVIAVDTQYYCRPVFSSWNLVAYNVFGGEDRGPELYGVEPWSFFFKNLTLNFGPVFALALFSPVIFIGVALFRPRRDLPGRTPAVTPPARSPARTPTSRGPGDMPFGSAAPNAASVLNSPLAALKFATPFLLWFVFWLRIPHKEERFMAPAYGSLAAAAALAVTAMLELGAPRLLAVRPATPPPSQSGRTSQQQHQQQPPRGENGCGCGHSHGGADASAAQTVTRDGVRHIRVFSGIGRICRIVAALCLAAGLSTCLCRLAAMSVFYGAPESSALALYGVLERAATERPPDAPPLRVCVGREWHRHPSSFFIPTGVEYAFTKTSFSGALPRPFGDGGSCASELSFNDLNKEEAGQSIAPQRAAAECDAYVDSFVAGEIDELPVRTRSYSSRRDPEAESTTSAGGPFFEPVPVATLRMLDPARTPQHCRIGYLPGLSDSCARWGDYFVLAKEGSAIAKVSADTKPAQPSLLTQLLG